MTSNRHHANRPTALTAADRAKVAQPYRKPFPVSRLVKYLAVLVAIIAIAKEIF